MPTPATDQPSGPFTNAVDLVDTGEHRVARQEIDRTLAQVGRRGPVVREHGQVLHHTEADGVRAAAWVDHRVAQQRGTRAGRRHHRATLVGREQRREQRRLLEHRPQVQRRAVGQVHELRRPDHFGHRGILGLGPVQHRQGPDLRAELPEVGLGALPHPLRVLVRGRGGQHHHLVGAAAGEEIGVEVTRPGTPFAAADQRERTGGAAGSHRGGD